MWSGKWSHEIPDRSKAKNNRVKSGGRLKKEKNKIIKKLDKTLVLFGKLGNVDGHDSLNVSMR